MRVARQVVLNSEQRQQLAKLARARSAPARAVERARIVLLAADGLENKQIAAIVKSTAERVARWRNRFLDGGVKALEKDAPRAGRKRSIGKEKIQEVVNKTTQEKPDNATHWSTRTMAKAAGISEKSVRRIWRQYGLKPHLIRTFKVSNDPLLSPKTEYIVGLYVKPPEHAIVLCVDKRARFRRWTAASPACH